MWDVREEKIDTLTLLIEEGKMTYTVMEDLSTAEGPNVGERPILEEPFDVQGLYDIVVGKAGQLIDKKGR